MKTLISLVTIIISSSAFASITAEQVVDGRSYTAAIGSNKIIRDYMTGRRPASEEVFVEVLQFAYAMDSRQTGLNERATEVLRLAEEVGNQITGLSESSREALKPAVSALLTQYPARTKMEVLIRIYDRLWLWSPDHLDFMARKIRGDSTQLISTELMWVLEQATHEQRTNFFSQVPERQLNPLIRWFPYALAYKYGRAIDKREMKKRLALANPDNLRPPPRPLRFKGATLPTAEDLYSETKTRLQNEMNCGDYFASMSPQFETQVN